jgi:hypothetical protein
VGVAAGDGDISPESLEHVPGVEAARTVQVEHEGHRGPRANIALIASSAPARHRPQGRAPSTRKAWRPRSGACSPPRLTQPAPRGPRRPRCRCRGAHAGHVPGPVDGQVGPRYDREGVLAVHRQSEHRPRRVLTPGNARPAASDAYSLRHALALAVGGTRSAKQRVRVGEDNGQRAFERPDGEVLRGHVRPGDPRPWMDKIGRGRPGTRRWPPRPPRHPRDPAVCARRTPRPCAARSGFPRRTDRPAPPSQHGCAEPHTVRPARSNRGRDPTVRS